MKSNTTDDKRLIKENENERPLWRKINILDILILLVILTMAFAAASFFAPFSLFGLGAEQRIISYTIEIESIDGRMADNIKVGDTAFDAAGKNAVGVVTSLKKLDAVRYVYNPESMCIEAVSLPADANGNIPVTIQVTIQVTADFKAGSGYLVGGNRVSVGTSLELCFAGYTGAGQCIALYGVALER